MGMKQRETQRHGSIDVRELGHAWARLDCLNSSPSRCVPSPPGKTLKPGFLSHGGVRFVSVSGRTHPAMNRGKGRTETLNVERTRQSTTGSPPGSNAQGDRVPVVGVSP